MICEYCNTKLSNKYALASHQSRAKYCLSIQRSLNIDNIESKLQVCSYCKINVSNLQRHEETCKMKDKYVIEKYERILDTVKQEHMETVKMFNFILDRKNDDIHELEKRIAGLESGLQSYKDMHDRSQACVERIAEQPKNTKIMNTTNINMTPLDLSNENVSKAFVNFTRNHLYDGQKGVAEFVADNLLTDENGDSMYTCVDSSRRMFKYVDKDGNVIKDMHARKLTNSISSEVIDKATKIYQSIPDKSPDNITRRHFTNGYDEIKDLQTNNSKFKTSLAERIV